MRDFEAFIRNIHLYIDMHTNPGDHGPDDLPVAEYNAFMRGIDFATANIKQSLQDAINMYGAK